LDRALGGERLVVDLDTPPMLTAVQEAAVAGTTLSVTYYSASSDRVSDRLLAPERVFASGGHWYLDARCGPDGDRRRFRVDRISQVRPAEAADQVPPGDGAGAAAPAAPAASATPGFDTFVPGPDTRTVRLAVVPSLGWVFDSIPAATVAGGAGGGEGVGGGRLQVEVAVGGDAWLQRLLLRLGSGATVLDPPEDAGLAAEAAVRILLRYGADTRQSEE
jgi:proteasome accessory factor C